MFRRRELEPSKLPRRNAWELFLRSRSQFAPRGNFWELGMIRSAFSSASLDDLPTVCRRRLLVGSPVFETWSELAVGIGSSVGPVG